MFWHFCGMVSLSAIPFVSVDGFKANPLILNPLWNASEPVESWPSNFSILNPFGNASGKLASKFSNFEPSWECTLGMLWECKKRYFGKSSLCQQTKLTTKFGNHIASRWRPPRAGYRRGTGEVMQRCWRRSCRGTWEVSRSHFLNPLLLLTVIIFTSIVRADRDTLPTGVVV